MASKRENTNKKPDPSPSNRAPGPYEDDVHFMAVALLFAKKSPDPSTQVGACIVNEKQEIVGVGYNKMPDGCEDAFPWERKAGHKLDTKYLYVCHAELNAIMNKTSVDVKGCTIYVTLFPCNECTKVIIQSGITGVVYLSNKYAETDEVTASVKMLTEAQIVQRQFVSKKEVSDLLKSIDPFAE